MGTTAQTQARFRSLGDGADLADDYVNPYYIEDLKHRISVARTGGAIYAFDDLCTCVDEHPCPLSAGLLKGTTLMCQCHGSEFDITSGAVLRGPATKALGTYPVREQDGTIEVEA